MGFSELLKSKGLSKSELGKRLGVSYQLVYNWTTGRSEPQMKVVKKLAKALGISLDELIDSFCEKEKTNDRQAI